MIEFIKMLLDLFEYAKNYCMMMYNDLLHYSLTY